MAGLSESFVGLAQTNNGTLRTGPIPPMPRRRERELLCPDGQQHHRGRELRLNNEVGQPKMVVTPRPSNLIWKGTGGLCEFTNDGDPIVNYDEAAGRWLVSQFALDTTGPFAFHECIAISKTADPTGSWYAYDYLISTTKMNDYPKFGIWPDGYYMSVNQFDFTNGGDWAGTGAVVFERAKMLAGSPGARMIYLDTYAGCPGSGAPECDLGGTLPADLEGVPPLPGAPNAFVQFDDDSWGYSGDQLQVWEFRTNWAAGTASFSQAATLPVSAFVSEVCPGYSRSCIPQPGTAQGLDAIADRLMYRAQFRNRGFYNSLVLNHTVKDGHPGGGPLVRAAPVPERRLGRGSSRGRTRPPTPAAAGWAASRWTATATSRSATPSPAADIFPTIAYAGRLAGDPAGTLPQTEVIALSSSTAGGSQTGSAARWGDYSALDLAPDGCTFWYTNEYLRGTSGRRVVDLDRRVQVPLLHAGDAALDDLQVHRQPRRLGARKRRGHRSRRHPGLTSGPLARRRRRAGPPVQVGPLVPHRGAARRRGGRRRAPAALRKKGGDRRRPAVHPLPPRARRHRVAGARRDQPAGEPRLPGPVPTGTTSPS